MSEKIMKKMKHLANLLCHTQEQLKKPDVIRLLLSIGSPAKHPATARLHHNVRQPAVHRPTATLAPWTLAVSAMHKMGGHHCGRP